MAPRDPAKPPPSSSHPHEPMNPNDFSPPTPSTGHDITLLHLRLTALEDKQSKTALLLSRIHQAAQDFYAQNKETTMSQHDINMEVMDAVKGLMEDRKKQHDMIVELRSRVVAIREDALETNGRFLDDIMALTEGVRGMGIGIRKLQRGATDNEAEGKAG